MPSAFGSAHDATFSDRLPCHSSDVVALAFEGLANLSFTTRNRQNHGTAANLRGGCRLSCFHESVAAPSVGRVGSLALHSRAPVFIVAGRHRRIVIPVVIVIVIEFAIFFCEALDADGVDPSVVILLVWVVLEGDDPKFLDWELIGAVQAVSWALLAQLRMWDCWRVTAEALLQFGYTLAGWAEAGVLHFAALLFLRREWSFKSDAHKG